MLSVIAAGLWLGSAIAPSPLSAADAVGRSAEVALEAHFPERPAGGSGAFSSPVNVLPQGRSLFRFDGSEVDGFAEAASDAQARIRQFFAQPTILDELWDLFPGASTIRSFEWTLRAEALVASVLAEDVEVGTRFVDFETLNGAMAGFVGAGPEGEPLILVNRDWLAMDPSHGGMRRIALEEMGHAFDWILNRGVDSPGDEGEMFALRVLGVEVSEAERARIQSESDHNVIWLDGEPYEVEEAAITFAGAFLGTQPNNFSTTTALTGRLRFVSNPDNRTFESSIAGSKLQGSFTYTDSGNNEVSVTGEFQRRAPQGGGSIEALMFRLDSSIGSSTHIVMVLRADKVASYGPNRSGIQASANASPLDIARELDAYVAAIAPDPNASTLVVASPTVLVGGATTEITVTVERSGGTRMQGVTVVLEELAGGPGSTISAGSNGGLSDANGVVTFQVSGATPGLATYRATAIVDGTETILSNEGVLSLVDPSLNQLTITGPSSMAPGVTETYTVTRTDSSSNPLTTGDLIVSLSASGGTVPATVTIPSGSSSTTFSYANNQAGTFDLVATSAGFNSGLLSVTAQTASPAGVTPKDPGADPLGSASVGGTDVLTRGVTIDEGEPFTETFVADKSVTWTLEFPLGTAQGSGPFTLAVSNGEATVTLPDTMAPGTYVVYLVATDSSGNRTVIRITVTVDAVTPPAVTPKDPNDPSLGSADENGTPVATRDATVEESSPYAETFVADKSVTWTLEFPLGTLAQSGPFIWAVSGDTPNEVTVVLPGTVAPGVYIVYLVATDGAGNRTVVRITVTVEDVTPPTVESTDDDRVVVDDDGGLAFRDRVDEGEAFEASFEADESVTWTLEAEEGTAGYTGPFELDVVGGVATVSLPSDTPPGVYTVYLVVADASGNRTVVEITVTVEAPPAPVRLDGVAGDRKVDLSWSVDRTTWQGVITGYDVEYRTFDGNWVPAGTFPSMEAEILQLQNGIVHDFRVAVRSDLLVGPFSASLPLLPLGPGRDAQEALPTPEIGDAAQVVDGEIRPLSVERSPDGVSFDLSEGVGISLSAVDRSGSPFGMGTSEGPVVVLSDGAFIYGGRGFLPTTVAALWIYPVDGEPRLLGTSRVSGNGQFSGSAPIPDDLAPGIYVVQVTGVDKDRESRAVAITVSIELDDALTIRVQILNERPVVGEEVQLLVTVTNESRWSVPDVVVVDAVPTARFTILDWVAEVGDFTPADGIWTIGTMEAGGVVTLSIRARVTSPAINQEIIR